MSHVHLVRSCSTLLTIAGLFSMATNASALELSGANNDAHIPDFDTITGNEIIVQLEADETPTDEGLDEFFSVRRLNRKFNVDPKPLNGERTSYLLEFESQEQAMNAKEKYEKNGHTNANYNYLYEATAIVSSESLQKVRVNDALIESQNNLSQIQAREAWTITKGSPEVIVAVIDSGIDNGHPDLRDSMWKNTADTPHDGIDNDGNGYVDDYDGWSFVDNNNQNEPKPQNGAQNTGIHHGTHVAGVIAATANNHIGMAGVAPNVKIMNLKILNHDGIGTTADLIEAIDYARSNGADVINLSITASVVDSSIDRPIRDAHNHEIVFAAAMGNTGKNLDQQHISPVANDVGVNAILGVTSVNINNSPSGFTNYGHGADIAAPGEQVWSTMFTNDTYTTEYTEISGTSQSAPQVAAVAALIRSVQPRWGAEKITNHILENATNVGFDEKYGKGVVNAFKPLYSAQNQEEIAILRNDIAAGTRSTRDQNVFVYNAPHGGEQSGETGKDLWSIPTGNTIEFMTGLDYDGDSKKEIGVIKNEGGDRNFYIYGTPSGSEHAPLLANDNWNIPEGNIKAITGIDYDGDRIDEIAVMRAEGNGNDFNLYIYEPISGTGAATLVATDYFEIPSGNNVIAMAGVDANGDGQDELAVMKNDGGDFNLYVYEVPQGFGQGRLIGADLWNIPAGNNAVAMTGVDYDGNGTDEIAVLKAEASGRDQNLYVYAAPMGEQHCALLGWDNWNIPGGNNGIAIAGVR